MIAPGTIATRPAIVTHAMERRELAFLRGLADTCREWPELRQWLCGEFVQNSRTRQKFAALVDAPASDPSDDGPQQSAAGNGARSSGDSNRCTDHTGHHPVTSPQGFSST